MFRSRCLLAILTIGLLSVLGGCPSSKGPGTGDTMPGGGTGTGPAAGSGSGDAVFPEEEFRKTQPAATAPRDFQLPEIAQFKLGDQIDVYLVEQHDLPTVSLELNFDGGSINDARGKEGMASVCMNMLSEGTKKLDKISFNEALADIASNISSYAGDETQGVAMRTLTKNLDPTFELFVETLTSPGFRKSDLDRMVARRLEALKQAKGSPGSVAGRVAPSIIYGPKHPFGKIVTEKSLERLTTRDCKRYHRAYLKPAGARLFVVGDMTEEQIRAKFEPLLQSWKGRPKKSARLPEPSARRGKVFFVNIPGAAQSTIWAAHMGPGRTAEDYFANEAMAGVLGGSFSSRINMNLREDKGYSYGARGRFRYNRHYGYFAASSSVRSNSTRQSLLEVFSEIENLKSGSEPVTEAELTREKNGAILGLPAGFATARQTLGRYRSLVYFGLPLDYYNSYVDKVSEVGLEAVMESAKKHLRPQESLILVVGDGKSPQIVRDEAGNDVPLTDSEGKQVLLIDALEAMASAEIGGKGSFVVMDADGVVQ